MDQFREEIKDDYIMELDLNPITYDERRGIDRKRSDPKPYDKLDDADRIIIRIARKCFKSKKQLKRTFAALYHCYTLPQTQRYLSEHAHKDVEDDIPIKTVQTYMKRVIDEITKVINNDDSLKKDIHNAIKKEYERRKNK